METQVSVQPEIEADLKRILEKVANTIRHLSMDAIQKANSGHPGLPMGCAELGAYLYGHALRHHPKNPSWFNRDRFILSAGHGSMLLYSCLHLAGFDLSLEDIQEFRQYGSKTPGHPENLETAGVETTTGPLGQGLGHAVGQALGLKFLEARFNTEEHTIVDNKVFALVGDGDVMEGVASEASSFAGHMKLDNLIVFYDSNKISLDGPLSESCSEDTKARYKSYGWDVYEVDGHDLSDLYSVCNRVRKTQKKPCLLIMHTTIGKGSPNKAGTHKIHGAPLGEEEVLASKENLGLPEESFFVPQAVRGYFEKKLRDSESLEEKWQKTFADWADANPDLYEEFEKMRERKLPIDLEESLQRLEMPDSLAGRVASQKVLNALASSLPQLYGGSADLSCSDMTMMQNYPVVAPGRFTGRNIKYGVREFAMASIATGMAQTKMMTPFCGTFLTFSDYMRNAIRLSALMKEQVIYQLTHDSIFLGEDGPTHQPVEHLASLRAIPQLQVIRPADNHEVKMAWLAALNYKGPTALILSRQKLPVLEETKRSFSEGLGRGAYIVRGRETKPDYTLFSSGSELFLALDVAQELEKIGKEVRVISMPSWEIFESQDEKYKASIVRGDLGKRISIEAGIEQGWYKYIGMEGIAICVESFGASAPAGVLAKEFGFTVESILERIL